MLKFVRNNLLNSYFFFLIIIKILIAGGTPILAYAQAVHDDSLMVSMATNILQGKWLGSYTQMTFIKGIVFPLFLDIVKITNIPFTIAQILFYAFSCYVFVKSLSKAINSNILKAILFTLLFFVPVTFATGTFMRVYRCNITPAQILLLLGCLFGLYLNKNENFRVVLKWGIASGLAFATMWNTREDGIWILPVFLFIIVISIITLWISNKNDVLDKKIKKVIPVVIPIIVFLLFNYSLSFINYVVYGKPIINELNDGNFPKMIKTIYKIQPKEDIYRVSVPKSTIDEIYMVSPTFTSLKDLLDQNYGGGWDATDGTIDGQIMDGWFFWCLRDVVYAKGYYETPQKADEFYGKVASEIEAALKDGRLKRRNGFGMPSALMSPWKQEYVRTLPTAIKEAYLFVARNSVDDANAVESIGPINRIRIFENITNNLAIYPMKKTVIVSGWATSLNETKNLNVYIYKNGDKFKQINRVDAPDVYGYLTQKHGTDLPDFRKTRFSDSIELGEQADVFKLVFEVDGKSVSEIPLDGSINQTGQESNDFEYCIDSIQLQADGDITARVAQPRLKIMNFVMKPYKATGIYTFLLGWICYILISIKLLLSLRSKKICMIKEWIILSCIAGSLFVLIFGVSYTHISAYNAIVPIYLSAAYILNIAFWCLGIIFTANYFISRKGVKNVKER